MVEKTLKRALTCLNARPIFWWTRLYIRYFGQELGFEVADQSDETPKEDQRSRKRTRMVRQYPVHPLEDALAVATAIQEVNRGEPFDRVLLAGALGTKPASSSYTTRLNASLKYGLTEGGYASKDISLTALGQSITAPTGGPERRQALVQAALRPELFHNFYRALDGKRMPPDQYARNTLQRDGDVHPDLTNECLGIIKQNGLFVGILGDVGGAQYVSLSGAHAPADQARPGVADVPYESHGVETADPGDLGAAAPAAPIAAPGSAARLLIAHAGDPGVVETIRRTFDSFGIGYAAIESADAVQHPPDRETSEALRSCDAAVLVLAMPEGLPGDGRIEALNKESTIFMLGAVALYGDRVVLLREKGLDRLPQEATLRTLQFRRDNLDELSLRLLQELHRMSVIQVSAHSA